jgi:hypothetical protein
LTAFIIIAIIIIVVYWFFFRKEKNSSNTVNQSSTTNAVEDVEIIEVPEEQLFIDENGLKYKNISRQEKYVKHIYTVYFTEKY